MLDHGAGVALGHGLALVHVNHQHAGADDMDDIAAAALVPAMAHVRGGRYKLVQLRAHKNPLAKL